MIIGFSIVKDIANESDGLEEQVAVAMTGTTGQGSDADLTANNFFLRIYKSANTSGAERSGADCIRNCKAKIGRSPSQIRHPAGVCRPTTSRILWTSSGSLVDRWMVEGPVTPLHFNLCKKILGEGVRLSLPRSRPVFLEFFLTKVRHAIFVGGDRCGLALSPATRLR